MRYIEEADKTLIKKFDEIRQKGYYVNSNQVTSLYNKILEKNVNNTTCGSCLRGRIQELVNALKRQEEQEAKEAAKKAVEEAKTEEVDNLPEEEKEANTEQINEVQNNMEETEKEAEVENVCDELVIEEIKEEAKDAVIEGTPEEKPRGKGGRKKQSK